ncbi:MAG: nitroreductase/quinone reductase family protein [Polyangiaceae bacterium]|jgi:hypothetical protein
MSTIQVDPRKDPAEQGHLRHFYRDWRPTRLGRMVNGAWAWLCRMGLTPPILVALQVKGRRSGLLRTTVLVPAECNGGRYLVSMLGQGSDWVRNVRAARGEAFIKRGTSRPVRLTEVPPADRAPILKAYCRVATSGRHHFPVPYDAPVSAFDEIASQYPVFRIDPR